MQIPHMSRLPNLQLLPLIHRRPDVPGKRSVNGIAVAIEVSLLLPCQFQLVFPRTCKPAWTFSFHSEYAMGPYHLPPDCSRLIYTAWPSPLIGYGFQACRFPAGVPFLSRARRLNLVFTQDGTPSLDQINHCGHPPAVYQVISWGLPRLHQQAVSHMTTL